jgi:hypothetical protein
MEIILYSNKQILGGFVLITLIGLLFVINLTLSNSLSNSYQGMNLSYFIGPLILTICMLSILYIKSLQDSIQLTMDKYILPDNFTMVNCPDGYNKQTHNGNIKCEPIVGSGDTVVEEGFTDSSTLFIAAQENLSCLTGKINGMSAQEYCQSVGKKLKINGLCSTSGVTDGLTQLTGPSVDDDTYCLINSDKAVCQRLNQGDSQSCEESDCCEDQDICFPGPNHQSNFNCSNGFNPKLQLASNGYIPQPVSTTPCADGRSTEIPNQISNWSPLDSDPYTYCKSPTGSGSDQICPPLDGAGNVNIYELGYECTQSECCECTSPRIINNGVCECPAGMDSIITSTDYGDIHSCACPGEKILSSSGSCSCPDPLMDNDYDNCPCPTTHFTQGTGSSAVCLPNSSLDTTTPVSVPGCMDQSATNYNPVATEDNGSCEYTVPGCMDQSATNYNPVATQDDGSCQYPNTNTGGDAVDATGAVGDTNTGGDAVGATGAVGDTGAQPLSSSDTLQESYSYPKKAFYLNGNTNVGSPCSPDNIEQKGCFNKFPNRIEKCKKIEDFLQNYRAVLNNWTDFQKECQV